MPSIASRPYTARVGNKTVAVPTKWEEHAAYYDGNGDHKVTLTEIRDKLTRIPEAMSVDTKDYAVSIRQQMLELKSPHLDAYPSNKEIEKKLKDLAKLHRAKAQVVTIGESTEGRPIKALRVSHNVRSKASHNKPSVVITGNLHAREWAANGAVTAAAEKLLEGANEQALEDLEVWFVPNANPDGYEHSRNVNPMWRKNTWRNDQGEIAGVDLNRNFSQNYRKAGDTAGSSSDDQGASDLPENDTFRGTGPLSEPETQAVKGLLDQETNAVGVLDVHSFGRMILVSEGEYDVSREEYNSIADSMNKAIGRVDYSILSVEELYPATGGFSEYADSLGKVGMTLEIGTSFQPNPNKAVGIIERASNGIVEFVNQMEERVSAT